MNLTALGKLSLYLIEILHQTTTIKQILKWAATLYLIEILHQTTTLSLSIHIGYRLYLIEILHQTTTCIRCESILLSCILSKFYIKPQRYSALCLLGSGCILSKFYIKPQLTGRTLNGFDVVSYRNSTSNHNMRRITTWTCVVVSYRNSTSNHNVWLSKATHKRLYLIEILHQTTTPVEAADWPRELYLIEILHQTTTIRLIAII